MMVEEREARTSTATLIAATQLNAQMPSHLSLITSLRLLIRHQVTPEHPAAALAVGVL